MQQMAPARVAAVQGTAGIRFPRFLASVTDPPSITRIDSLAPKLKFNWTRSLSSLQYLTLAEFKQETRHDLQPAVF